MVSQIIVFTALALNSVTGIGGDSGSITTSTDRVGSVTSVAAPAPIIDGVLHVANGDGMIGSASL